MLSLVAAIALVAGQVTPVEPAAATATSVRRKVVLTPEEALSVKRKILFSQIGSIQRAVPVALDGDPIRIQEYRNKRIKPFLDECRGEDRHDTVNRFFRVGIAP
jgi:hypothetical protein